MFALSDFEFSDRPEVKIPLTATKKYSACSMLHPVVHSVNTVYYSHSCRQEQKVMRESSQCITS